MTHTGRRWFLYGSGAAVAGMLWSSCGGKKKVALRCDDTAELAPAAVQTRTSLAYVEQSTKAGQECSNCRFFQSKGADKCGGCTLMQGPINPKGYCNSWAAQPA